MSVNFFTEIFEKNLTKKAIIYDLISITYADLLNKISKIKVYLTNTNIKPSDVVVVLGDFSASSISTLFALIELNCIIVPISINDKNKKKKIYEIANADFIVEYEKDDKIKLKALKKNPKKNNLYQIIKKRNCPGLVLFSSGTSGEPKAAVHDFTKLLAKFKLKRKSLVTINFLLFDHWGGLNTMFHILSNAGTLVITYDRSPDAICKLIEKNKVELLPASPSFLNLFLLSNSHKKYKLNSLKIISYGTEPMPKTTLEKLTYLLPNVTFQQTYGLIELGVMRTKSESNGSLWLKIGGEGYQYRIRNKLLEIKAESAMLGYLNANSPFTKDGWYQTGDKVETKGEYIRIIGRKSEVINVGGDKVYPQEVENILLQMKNIADVTVYGEYNAILGNIVCCNILLLQPQSKSALKGEIQEFCESKLEKFKIPVKVTIMKGHNITNRLKKKR